MANNVKNKKIKRLPKGQRIHVRRLKQEAAKEGRVYKPSI
jgi:hypothetical protein